MTAAVASIGPRISMQTLDIRDRPVLQISLHPCRLVPLRLIRRRRGFHPRTGILQPAHTRRRGRCQQHLLGAGIRDRGGRDRIDLHLRQRPTATRPPSPATQTSAPRSRSSPSPAPPSSPPPTPSTHPRRETGRRSPTHPSAQPAPPPTSAPHPPAARARRCPRPAPSPPSPRAQQDQASRPDPAATRSTPAAPRTRRTPTPEKHSDGGRAAVMVRGRGRTLSNTCSCCQGDDEKHAFASEGAGEDVVHLVGVVVDEVASRALTVERRRPSR